MARKKNDGIVKELTNKPVKKIPDSENGRGVVCKTKSGKKYVISHSEDKPKHTLWLIVEDGYQKIATGESPYDLYELIDWDS